MIGRMINFKTDDPDKFVEKMESVSKNLTAKRIGRSNFHANIRLAKLSRTAFFSVNSSAKPPAMPGRMAKAMLKYLT